VTQTAENQTIIVPAERPEKKAMVAPAQQSMTPMDMISVAVQQGASIEKMQQLMELQERWEKNEARKAYAAAMTALHAAPPEIDKNKLVNYTTDTGTTSYRHTSLDHLAAAVSEKMSPHGLSFRWKTNRKDGGLIEVACIIQHVMGHSETVTLEAGLDQSGGKNNIQALGSTVKYLQRYTLEAAAGVASMDPLTDDDGRTPDSGPSPEPKNEPKTLPALEQAAFDKNWSAYQVLMDKKCPPGDIIKKLKSKYTLTQQQIDKIEKYRPQQSNDDWGKAYDKESEKQK